MSGDVIFLLIIGSIAITFLWAVRRGGPVPRRFGDALLSGAAGDAAGDTSMPIDGGHHGGSCDAGGHGGGGDAGSCDGGGGHG